MAMTSSTIINSIQKSAAPTILSASWTPLHEHGMGQILDIVPNHMGIVGNENTWWNDVLENGPCARHAGYFPTPDPKQDYHRLQWFCPEGIVPRKAGAPAHASMGCTRPSEGRARKDCPSMPITN